MDSITGYEHYMFDLTDGLIPKEPYVCNYCRIEYIAIGGPVCPACGLVPKAWTDLHDSKTKPNCIPDPLGLGHINRRPA